MKEYKINAPKMTNIKRVFVAKGHAVPEDLLDDVHVNQETTTYWEEQCGDDIVNSDEVATHFAGKWNYEISQLSNIQGHVSVEPIYSYDFPCEIIVPSRDLNDINPETGDALTYTPIHSIEKLRGTKLFGILSSIDNLTDEDSAYPVTAKTILQNSLSALSSANFESLSVYFNEYYALATSLKGSDGLYMPGDYKSALEEALRQLSSGEYDAESLNNAVKAAGDMCRIENYEVELSACPRYRLAIVPKYQKYTEVSLNVVPPAETNYYKVWQHTLGNIDNGGGDQYFNIRLLDFDQPVCSSLIICDGQVLVPSDFTVFAERPYAVFAVGDAFTNLVIWATNEEIYVHDCTTGNAREEQTIDEFLNAKYHESEIAVEFKLVKAGNSVNFNYVLMDEPPSSVEDVNLESRQYLETVIYADTRMLDGINTAPLADHFGLNPDDTKSTRETRFVDIMSNCNISIAEESEYSIVGVINLDDPVELYSLEDCDIYGMDEHGFKVNAPMNVCLVYAKNN